jgi:hypothetical protein
MAGSPQQNFGGINEGPDKSMTEPTSLPSFNVRRRNGTIEMIMKENVPKLNGKILYYLEGSTAKISHFVIAAPTPPEFLLSITWEHGWWIADADLEKSWPKSTS